MKFLLNSLVTATLVCCVTFANAQMTWVNGSNQIDHGGFYSAIGYLSCKSMPGSRVGGATWTGLDGNFYLFGGSGYAGGNVGGLNDLWRYDPQNDNWTWIGGSNQANPQNVSNMPPARFGAATWVDNNGNLWLFGGRDFTTVKPYNDLWCYSISANTWTYKGGTIGLDAPGVYGAKGISNPDNHPGARSYSVCWTDAEGKFWLFGGHGRYTSGNPNTNLNDLWKYDPVSEMWTWVSGDNNPLSPTGVYGTREDSDPNNKPGARQHATGWTDGDGNLWLFGGFGNAANSIGKLNDLWKFNPDNNEWAWMNGSNDINQISDYGVLGQPAPSNTPGARYALQAWTGSDGKAFIFGGYGADFHPDRALLNDLWQYDMTANEWTWIGGSEIPNTSGNYITTQFGEIMPGGRHEYMKWQLGNTLYVFGGGGLDHWGTFGMLNDLWEIDASALATTSSARSVGTTKKTNVKTAANKPVNIGIFPNPATDKIFIKLPSEIIKGTVSLYSVQGTCVLSQNLQQNSTLHVKSLPKGAYYLKIIYNNNTLTRKVILK